MNVPSWIVAAAAIAAATVLLPIGWALSIRWLYGRWRGEQTPD